MKRGKFRNRTLQFAQISLVLTNLKHLHNAKKPIINCRKIQIKNVNVENQLHRIAVTHIRELNVLNC